MSLISIDQIQYLQLEPTSYCNAACPHCPRVNSLGELNVKPEHWNALQILENLELEKMSSLKYVKLEGDNGDPLMHPEIDYIIEKFISHQNKPEVTVITNGSIRSPSWWRNLKKADNLQVVFSIDGLADTNHLYRINLEFDKIIANAKAFIESGGNAVWKFILFKHNQHQIEEAIKLSKELGFTSIQFALPIQSRFEGSNIFPIRQQDQLLGYLEYPDFIGELQANSHNTIHNQSKVFELPIQDPTSYHICPNLMTGRVYITASGHLLPCCQLNFQFEQNKLLSELVENFDSTNLHQIKISSILDNAPLIKNLHDQLYDGIKMPDCNGCKSRIDFARNRYIDLQKNTHG